MSTSQCVICNSPFELDGKRYKTCSTPCARENDRRVRARKRIRYELKYPEKIAGSRARPRRQRNCRICGVDISHLRYVRTCGNHKIERALLRPCRKCGEIISVPRLVCDQCKAPKLNYIADAKTFEQKIERLERQKIANKKHKAMVRAAYQAFRDLQATPEKSPKPVLPLPTCVVCEKIITAPHKRILCGAQSCKEERERERSRCTHVGGRLSQTARMIVGPNGKHRNMGKFRDAKRQLTKQRISPEKTRRRYQRQQAVYRAMRELNLVPTKEDER